MNNSDFKSPEQVEFIIFDFDGVFTDNKVYVSQDGTEAVVCDRRDGLGVEMLKQARIPMLILSKERNPVVVARSEKLGMEVKTGCDNKKRFLLDFLRQKGVDSASVIYVGNDLNDLDAMETVGCSICPSDSHKKVKENATYILTSKGGNGAVRELAELLIQNKGK